MSSPLPVVSPGGGGELSPAVHASEKPLDALRKARRSAGSLGAGRTACEQVAFASSRKMKRLTGVAPSSLDTTDVTPRGGL